MIGNSWDILLSEEYKKDYFKNLKDFVISEYKNKIVYPKISEIFKAFIETSYEDVKVVIIGQDPYHGPNQAHGLCFSVQKGVAIPPSLQNIYKEINRDIGCKIPHNGDLTKWAKQGVLLLNSVLTVRAGYANSHKNKGWEQLTSAIIEKLNQRKDPIVFILWGANAKEIGKNIDTSKHFVLTAPHPSPLSAYSGFFGCKHFSKTNEFLTAIGKKPIDWQIEDI